MTRLVPWRLRGTRGDAWATGFGVLNQGDVDDDGPKGTTSRGNLGPISVILSTRSRWVV